MLKVLSVPAIAALILAVDIASGIAPGPRVARADAEEQAPLSNRQISRAISQRLLSEGFDVHPAVSVATADGVVTLSGKVGTLQQKERAVQIAGAVRGVRSVVSRLSVAPTKRTDDEIRASIQRALSLDPLARGVASSVRVERGQAVLMGLAGSWAVRELVSWIAKGTPGVRGVQNRIRIAREAERSDPEIRQAIVSRLRRDPWIDEKAIEVSVNRGHVRLSGKARSLAQKNRLRLAAAADRGVISIDLSGIRIDPEWPQTAVRREAPIRGEKEIAASVRDSLELDPRVGDGVSVKVRNGVVDLAGRAGTLREYRAAEEDARNTPGVLAVNNRIRIQAPPGASDARIAQDIRSALALDPDIEARDLIVTVRKGVADVAGQVGSPFERSEIHAAISRTPGILAIDDNLEIVSVGPRRAGASPRPGRDDRELKQAIQEVIDTDWHFDPTDRVRVSVANGIATIRGRVSSPAEKWAAGHVALDAGARGIENRLQVETGVKDRLETRIPRYPGPLPYGSMDQPEEWFGISS